jgi:hypothetical protein
MKKILQVRWFCFFYRNLYVGFNYPKLDLISGFSAKSMASGHFIDNRSRND